VGFKAAAAAVHTLVAMAARHRGFTVVASSSPYRFKALERVTRSSVFFCVDFSAGASRPIKEGRLRFF
jgi:hypothetical protein